MAILTSPASRPSRAPAAVAARPRRLVVHDYSGHPFQVQLSRELAARGHDVLHLHCPEYHSGKGALERTDADAPGFHVAAVSLPERFHKYSWWKRLRQEREYARLLVREVERFAPEALVSSNNPLFSQQLLLRMCERRKIPFVFWQQDVYSAAMKRVAERRVPVLGRAVGRGFVALERGLLRRSAAVVAISSDFAPVLRQFGVADERVHVIENWAPLEELPLVSRDNAWAREHGLVGKRVLLYAGTLGLKHNPGLIVALAERLASQPDVRVVVVSEGVGADWLRGEQRKRGLANLLVLDFQPYRRLAEVMASGDVLLVILEPEAGAYSVPSKVLSYHCAGRPLLAALPAANLAARLVQSAGSGLVVDPRDADGLGAAATRLLAEPELRARMGRAARAHAEEAFDIGPIGARFEAIIETAVRGAG